VPEKTVLELKEELDGGLSGFLLSGEDSKSSLAATKKRQELELKTIQTHLDKVQDERDLLEALQLSNKSEIESLRSKNQDDLDARDEKLEESRRALLAAHRLSDQEMEKRIQEIGSLEDQKKSCNSSCCREEKGRGNSCETCGYNSSVGSGR
jgi:myosin protein heavy chain